MSLDQAIHDACLADSAVANIVSTRVYPMYVPQGETGAAVVYHIISGDDEYVCDGAVGLPDIRVQITAFSAQLRDGGTHVQCVELYRALVALWKHYVGTVGGETIQGTHIIKHADIDSFDDKDENASRWGRAIDVIVSYEE
ncbi:MAG: hypothetical protein A2Y76_01635 [Planctomycetes bacterium RBG_13_60_9]|nr:MAG: hypothetical protein A2Y76_01635 [Planctomycetes bacterium RBG_13_60_9]